MKKQHNKWTCEATIQQSQPFIFFFSTVLLFFSLVCALCLSSHWLALSLSLALIVDVYCYCCCLCCWCFVRIAYLYETSSFQSLYACVYCTCACECVSVCLLFVVNYLMCCAFFLSYFILYCRRCFCYCCFFSLIVKVFVCLFTIVNWWCFVAHTNQFESVNNTIHTNVIEPTASARFMSWCECNMNLHVARLFEMVNGNFDLVLIQWKLHKTIFISIKCYSFSLIYSKSVCMHFITIHSKWNFFLSICVNPKQWIWKTDSSKMTGISWITWLCIYIFMNEFY